MTVYIHFSELPNEMTLAEVEAGLADCLDDSGYVSWSTLDKNIGRIDLELKDEDDNTNPKYAQLTAKAYLQSIHFAKDTKVEIGGMEINLYA